jgi:dihydroorotate dehydrogenase electron transfer subunit
LLFFSCYNPTVSPIKLQSRLPTTYRIQSVKQETDMVRTLTFDGSLGAKPGQFLMVWLPGVDEVPMSVADDNGSQTKITFFAVGDMTSELAKCQEGDLVGLRGPFGTHYDWKPGEHIALVAGGYGAAPMHFLAQSVEEGGCTVEAIVGARGKEHLLYLDELGALPHVTLHVTTDDGSMGFKGRNVEYLEKMLEAGGNDTSPIDRVFGCGPERMLTALSDVCHRRQLPAQLSLERFMKCGYGLCGNCVVDPLGIRLCVDGPVVDNETCRRITELGQYHRDSVGRKCKF